MDKFDKTDALLRRALAVEAPDTALLGQVKASLGKEQDMKTSRFTKRAATAALAAALALALSVTAYAAFDGADWFKSWFADQTRSELTEGQMAYVDQAAAGVGQSVTSDGWTITLDSAMTDGKYCYMKLDIRAPEGLEAEENFAPFPDGTLVSTAPGAAEDLFSGGGGCVPVEDAAEGVYGFMLEKSIPIGREGEADWSCPLELTLDQLTDGRVNGLGLLSRGPWVFRFTLTPPARQEAELVDEPFTAKGIARSYFFKGVPMDQVELEPGMMIDTANGLRVVEEQVDVTVTSLKLSPMGAVCTFEYPRDQRPIPTIDPWELEVAFAGGTAEIVGTSDHWPEGENGGVCVTSMEFAAPIDLDEVTAVAFQGRALALPD